MINVQLVPLNGNRVFERVVQLAVDRSVREVCFFVARNFFAYCGLIVGFVS